MAEAPKNQSAEKNGNGKPRNEPGLYFHPDSGEFVETKGTKAELQADAFTRVGFRLATAEEAAKYKASQEKGDK